MQEWKCTIKTPSNWLQTVYVEAYTREDAVAAAEHSTGGKCIFCNVSQSVAKWESPFSNNSASNSNSDTEMSFGTAIFLLLLLFIFAAWKYMLIIGGIAVAIWFLLNTLKE